MSGRLELESLRSLPGVQGMRERIQDMPRLALQSNASNGGAHRFRRTSRRRPDARAHGSRRIADFVVGTGKVTTHELTLRSLSSNTIFPVEANPSLEESESPGMVAGGREQCQAGTLGTTQSRKYAEL